MIEKNAVRHPKRLERNARMEMILDEAVRFFAQYGFTAQITDLAARLHISHSLIFRYFGTKQNLLDQVYDRVYGSRWSNKWVRNLADRSVPLRQRIEIFYLSFLEVVDNPDWIRIALYAGLAGEHLKRAYKVRDRMDKVMGTILRELRFFRGLPESGELTEKEWEIAYHLHSSIIYLLMRKHVLSRPEMHITRADVVGTILDNFMAQFEREAAAPSEAAGRSAARSRGI